MSGTLAKYVGQDETIIVLQPDESLGPFLPLDVITAIGFALITALTTAAGRAAIQAAARGANSDITAILGMPAVLSATQVLTPSGTANAAVLAAMLGGFFPNPNVQILTAGTTTLDGTAGTLWFDSTGGAVICVVPRSLGPKLIFGIMTAGSAPVTVQDDLGAVKFVMLAAGQAMVTISVASNTVVAGGVQ